MAKKFSNHSSFTGSVTEANARRDAPVFAVVSDPSFFERVRSECSNLPGKIDIYANISLLLARLGAMDKVGLAFVLFFERHASSVDVAGVRTLRLDFPQIIPAVIAEECDQRCELRLQSIGVHSIMLPPFAEVDVGSEIATITPNVPKFKRHPDLMRRGQVRLDFLVPSDLSYVLGINYEISMLLKEFGFSQQDSRVNIPLACDEAITNAIVHGNRSQADKKVNVQVYISHSRFRIRVRDQGDGFDADSVADPRDGDNVHRSSGRGIFLMRKIMDSVEYKEGGRVLELEKRNQNSKRNGPVGLDAS
jgi:serine/threonine-protein kinase RsbW